MIRHIYVHDNRRKAKKTRDGAVTGRVVQAEFNGKWYTVPARTRLMKVGADWVVASVSDVMRIAGVDRFDAEHRYMRVPTDSVVVGPMFPDAKVKDGKLSPEDIAEIRTEKRRKGWSEAQIREYIKEQEAKTGDADREPNQSDIQAAQRGLNMVGMSVADLRDLAREHQGENRLFASKVIALAAMQMIAVKKQTGARDITRDGYIEVADYGDWKTEVRARWPDARIAGNHLNSRAWVKEDGRDVAAAEWNGKEGWIKTE